MTSRDIPLRLEDQSWLTWPGDPDVSVSDFGAILCCKHRWWTEHWTERTQHVINSGYLVVGISGHGSLLVHRLVAQTWIMNRNPTTHREVNHLDGDKFNNHVTNLEWCTRSQNMRHAHDQGLCVGPSRMRIEVIGTDMVFDSQLEAARTLNLNQGDISNALHGRVNHVRGYQFRKV